MTGQIISPSAATTTIADVTDAAHTTNRMSAETRTHLSLTILTYMHIYLFIYLFLFTTIVTD